MQSSYDLNNENNDTTSSYYQLLHHLIYLSENPSIFKDLSPSLHIEAIKSIIAIDKKDNDFYKVIYFILFQGIVHESENYAKSKKYSDKIPLIDAEQGENNDYQILSIVDVEEEKALENSTIYDCSCDENFFVVVEKMPEWKGGEEDMEKYLHVNSPEIKGTVFIGFVIDCNGRLTSTKILKRLSPLTDIVAINLIKRMRNWTPGEQCGTKVNVQLTYPVVFD